MTRGIRRIGFLPRPGEESADGYLRRLARLRWRRRFPGRRPVVLNGAQSAAETFVAGDDWLVVRDEISLPVPGDEIARVSDLLVPAAGRPPSAPPVVHTLAELERARDVPGEGAGRAVPAIAFSVSDFPPAGSETVAEYVGRLASPATPKTSPGFAAVVFDDSAGERPEIVRHLHSGVRRLLDVGCGTGEVSAAIRRASPEARVTAIELDPSAADQARPRVHQLLECDAAEGLRRLAHEGARFDAFVFADVLEHLEDPIGALVLARELADPGATLVASVPNVGHLSVVRDLVRGRFDPLPAGLVDAGHLRWFTRSSLESALEEARWNPVHVEGLPGAPPPEADRFFRHARAFPEADEASLGVYQWIAVARTE